MSGVHHRAYIIDLKVRAARDRIYYPDGVIVCTPHDGDTLIFDAPCLILEVTSRSSRRIDRGEKLDAYLAMPSLRAYMIAEHDRRHVTLHSREVGGPPPFRVREGVVDDDFGEDGEEEDDDWAELLDLSSADHGQR